VSRLRPTATVSGGRLSGRLCAQTISGTPTTVGRIPAVDGGRRRCRSRRLSSSNRFFSRSSNTPMTASRRISESSVLPRFLGSRRICIAVPRSAAARIRVACLGV
jgi:hypothetical protein